jgi:hypothetical protein
LVKTYYGDLSNTIAPPVLVNSIWEQVRIGNESPETIRQIKQKAAMVAPGYNKGGLQVLSKEEMKNAGRKL